MSWIDDIQDRVFEIITGDGRSYFPKWRNAVKTQDYNVTEYVFIDVEGSYVDRKKARGRKFNLEFYFDGENALNLGNNFELSARDPRKWLIKHPFYGDIYCHPLGISQDNTVYNVSRFTSTVIETIGEGYPTYDANFADIIVEEQLITNEAQIEAYANADVMDRNTLLDAVDRLDGIFTKAIDDAAELNEYKTKVEEAVRAITNVTASATNVIRTVVNLINYPAGVVQTVEQRFNAFNEALTDLLQTIGIIDSTARTIAQKVEFETLAGTVIAAQQVAVSSNIENSYLTRGNVIDQQGLLLDDYDAYIEMLDENKTDRNDTEDSYSPNYEALKNLSNLVSISISNLYNIAFEAKQERTYTTDSDTNIINLCHRFYGLDFEDVNLTYFIDTNDFGIDEILNIKKGRTVLYYV